jgi:flagellar hook-associated protein 2
MPPGAVQGQGSRKAITMGITPLRFTGVSQFSQDFQVIVDRTVQIASLPAQLLMNDQQRLIEQKSAMGTLRSTVASLAASMDELSALGESKALSATVSSSKVRVTLDTSAAEPGVFTISEISSLAQRAVMTSTSGQATETSGPVAGVDGYLQLMVGGVAHEITLAPDKDNLAGARDAINALDAGVTASLVTADDGVYLSISASQTGATAIELRTVQDDPGSNLLGVTQAGADAVLKVNGQTVTRPENYIEGAVPGVSLTLNSLTEAGESIPVDLASSRAPVANALEKFAAAYNALNEQVAAAAAGALAGNSLVKDLQSRMRQIGGQFGEGLVQNLAEMGLPFDQQGVLTFDDLSFNLLSAEKFESIFGFLSPEQGGLGTLAGSFREFSDPLAGFMVAEIRSYDEADTRLQVQIDKIFERVNSTQQTLLARLQAADVLLAGLESQQNLLDASIESMRFSLYGRNDR